MREILKKKERKYGRKNERWADEKIKEQPSLSQNIKVLLEPEVEKIRRKQTTGQTNYFFRNSVVKYSSDSKHKHPY